MFFKGTATRGVGAIARETKSAGGYLNASTTYDHTSYYAVLPAASLAPALEIQADALRNSVIDAGELARELQVIIQEAKRKLDTPSALAYETLHEVMFDRHRMRRWRIGHEAQLARVHPRRRVRVLPVPLRPRPHHRLHRRRRRSGRGARPRTRHLRRLAGRRGRRWILRRRSRRGGKSGPARSGATSLMPSSRWAGAPSLRCTRTRTRWTSRPRSSRPAEAAGSIAACGSPAW